MEFHEFPGNGLLPPGRPVWLLSTRPNNTQTPKGDFWGTGGLYLGIVHLRHKPHPADVYTAAPHPQRVRFRSFLSSVEREYEHAHTETEWLHLHLCGHRSQEGDTTLGPWLVTQIGVRKGIWVVGGSSLWRCWVGVGAHALQRREEKVKSLLLLAGVAYWCSCTGEKHRLAITSVPGENTHYICDTDAGPESHSLPWSGVGKPQGRVHPGCSSFGLSWEPPAHVRQIRRRN